MHHPTPKQRTLALKTLPILALILLAIACAKAPALHPDRTAPPAVETHALHGKVIRVLDGDTIELLDADKTTHRVRLKGIDAPEKAQDFGTRSREQLATFAFNRDALVEWNERDRYGRIIGKLIIDGDDICLKMIETGLAWHFKRYEKTQSENERVTYAEAEQKSRSEKTGLWADPNPTPPWSFRHPDRTP